MNYNDLTFHSLTSMCSTNTPEEYEVIKKSIEDSGLQVKITLYEGKILSGRARYKACQELELNLTEKDFEDKSFASEDDAKQYVWDSNNARRNTKPEARLMDLLQNEDFVTRTEKDKKGYNRRKYIPILLAGDCTSNEVAVATRIYDKGNGHQGLIELYKLAKYPSTTFDLLAKQTNEYLDDLFKKNDQAIKDQIESLKKIEKEKKHKAKVSKLLPTWSSKVSTSWQLPMGQAPVSVELTPDLVKKTLLLWAKEGALNGVGVPNEVDEIHTPDDAFALLEDLVEVKENEEVETNPTPVGGKYYFKN